MQRHTSTPASSDLVSIQDLITNKLEQNSLDLKYNLNMTYSDWIKLIEFNMAWKAINYLTHGVQEPIHQILWNKISLFQILVAASREHDNWRFDR